MTKKQKFDALHKSQQEIWRDCPIRTSLGEIKTVRSSLQSARFVESDGSPGDKQAIMVGL